MDHSHSFISFWLTIQSHQAYIWVFVFWQTPHYDTYCTFLEITLESVNLERKCIKLNFKRKNWQSGGFFTSTNLGESYSIYLGQYKGRLKLQGDRDIWSLTLGAFVVFLARIWHARFDADSYQGDASTLLEGLSFHIWSKKKANARLVPTYPGTVSPSSSFKYA